MHQNIACWLALLVVGALAGCATRAEERTAKAKEAVIVGSCGTVGAACDPTTLNCNDAAPGIIFTNPTAHEPLCNCYPNVIECENPACIPESGVAVPDAGPSGCCACNGIYLYDAAATGGPSPSCYCVAETGPADGGPARSDCKASKSGDDHDHECDDEKHDDKGHHSHDDHK